MNKTPRRDFLKNAALTLAGSAALASTALAQDSSDKSDPKKRRIIALNTSHRAGMTCAAGLKIVLESVKEHNPDLETELIELAEVDFAQAVVGKDQPEDDLTPILNKIADPRSRCAALVIGSPVYFGLPSGRCVSFISRLMPLKRAGVFQNKTFGALAVGSGRNGGQETILHTLIDSMLTMQMIVAVDAVPSSHWGATLWNQDNSIEKDEFGIATAKNLGKRVVELIG